MSLPEEPYTRVERYLAKLAGQDVDIPDRPITRIECYLDYLVNNGGGVPAANAGAHNSVFRGKSLGSEFTADQANAIDDGSFAGLYLGDYWEMPWGEGESPSLVKFRIAGFDTYFKISSDSFNKHHVVVVPDTTLTTAQMNTTATTEGGYKGSYLKTTVLPPILTALEELFGSNNILERTSLLSINTSSVEPTLTRIDTMSLVQILGIRYSSVLSLLGEMTNQLPLFMADSQFTRSDKIYWTQDFGGTSFISVAVNGRVFGDFADTSRGVRPYFCLGKGATG